MKNTIQQPPSPPSLLTVLFNDHKTITSKAAAALLSDIVGRINKMCLEPSFKFNFLNHINLDLNSLIFLTKMKTFQIFIMHLLLC